MSTPRYKINPVTGELQEVSFDYNGIVALKNFTTRIDGERLIIHSADDVNFSILEALVSEVEINGVVYDNPEAAQEALQRLVFNQNRPVVLPESERLLLQSIVNKVDKENGKGLSTHDYSDEEKQKVQDTANKRVVAFTVTGDVNKVAKMTFEDGSTLIASFTDISTGNTADVMLNSLNFNTETGVLTGIRSDGQQITVDLNGRYSLLGHTHDWSDITGKPAIIPEAPNDGKNYVRKSNMWSVFNGLEKLPFVELEAQNLNDIKEFGFYGKYNSSEATSALNYPSNAVRGGHLMVLPMTVDSSKHTIFQIYWSAGTLSAGEYTDSARVYMRAFVNNAQWTQWREFDGGKLHQFTSATQNLQDLFNNTFPVDNSTFIVNQATTIQVANKTMRVSYIKNTTDNITFQAQSGVTLVGDTTITAPIGTKIDLDVQNGRGYINYQKPQNTSQQIDNNIGLWQ